LIHCQTKTIINCMKFSLQARSNPNKAWETKKSVEHDTSKAKSIRELLWTLIVFPMGVIQVYMAQRLQQMRRLKNL
jgi:hypothetical protein